jgi:hypothetical protein
MKSASVIVSHRNSELAQLNRDLARLQRQPGMPEFVRERLRFAEGTLAELAGGQRTARRGSSFAAALAPNPRIKTFGA